MAKRFTDSRKWDDPWFRKLGANYQILWLFMLDKCNHAGVWKVDLELAEIFTGCEYSEDVCKEVFKNRVIFLNDEKWFIPKFVEFQYGELNSDNRAHQSVLHILQKEGAYKHLNSPIQGCKDKDKDKDKDSICINNQEAICKDKDYQIKKNINTNEIFNRIWERYPRKIGKKAAERHFIASVKTEQDEKDIEIALSNYIEHAKDSDEKFIQHGSTWFNNWRDWLEYKPKKKPVPRYLKDGIN